MMMERNRWIYVPYATQASILLWKATDSIRAPKVIQITAFRDHDR